SLGRMVLNVDAHTSVGFTTDLAQDATPGPAGLKAWRYAYDDAGDLVGTSDARGCGVNYHYDGAGRPIAEDYSPCLADHAPYSAPNFANHTGVEVYRQYDTVSSGLAALVEMPAGYARTSANLKGRLAMSYDRGAQQYVTYDARGRTTRVERRVASPNSV